MTTVTIPKAKTELSKLIARVEKGEEIIIARGKQPVARLLPAARKRPVAEPRGIWKHIAIPDSFFEPLSEDELRDW
jgi:prevent-host-death family protein